MVLSPLQSWVLLATLAVAVIGGLYLASRPSWTHRRRHRDHDRYLDELARYERARERLAHQYATDNYRTRLGHTNKNTGNSND